MPGLSAPRLRSGSPGSTLDMEQEPARRPRTVSPALVPLLAIATEETRKITDALDGPGSFRPEPRAARSAGSSADAQIWRPLISTTRRERRYSDAAERRSVRRREWKGRSRGHSQYGRFPRLRLILASPGESSFRSSLLADTSARS